MKLKAPFLYRCVTLCLLSFTLCLQNSNTFAQQEIYNDLYIINTTDTFKILHEANAPTHLHGRFFIYSDTNLYFIVGGKDTITLDSTGFGGGGGTVLPDGFIQGEILYWNGSKWDVLQDNVGFLSGYNYFFNSTMFGSNQAPNYTISLNANTDQTIGMYRASNEGFSLTILAGSVVDTSTMNKDGGSLILSAGESSGTGSSSIIFKTAKAGTQHLNPVINKIMIDGSGNFSPISTNIQTLGTSLNCWDTLFVSNIMDCSGNGVNIIGGLQLTEASELPECGPTNSGTVRLQKTPGQPDKLKMCIDTTGNNDWAWVTISWD